MSVRLEQRSFLPGKNHVWFSIEEGKRARQDYVVDNWFKPLSEEASPRFLPGRPEKNSDPNSEPVIVENGDSEIGRRQFCNYGGDPERYSEFLALMWGAARANKKAHNAKAREDQDRYYGEKTDALLKILEFRSQGLKIVKVGLEYERAAPDDISRAYIDVHIIGIDLKSFHIPYGQLEKMVYERGFGTVEEFVGPWDEIIIGLQHPNILREEI